MNKFTKKKIGTNEFGNIYNYRGFIIHKEYLIGEGYNWLAGDNEHRYFDVVYMKSNKPLVMSNWISGGITYISNLSELISYIDEILEDDNAYISTSTWPFDFSENDIKKRKIIMEQIINKNKFEY